MAPCCVCCQQYPAGVGLLAVPAAVPATQSAAGRRVEGGVAADPTGHPTQTWVEIYGVSVWLAAALPTAVLLFAGLRIKVELRRFGGGARIRETFGQMYAYEDPILFFCSSSSI